MDKNEQYIKLNGTVEAVIFKNEDNGYAVLRFLSESSDDEIILTGIFPDISVGEELTVNGTWIAHPSYGEQFSAAAYERRLPADEKGIYDYLAFGKFKGIGAKNARQIVERFGKDTFSIISEHPERLAEIKGISLQRAIEIKESFDSKASMRILSEMFVKYGIPIQLVPGVYTVYGGYSVNCIKENPYILCSERWNIDFEIADKMAFDFGMENESERRIDEGIMYELTFNMQSGHTFVPCDKLIKVTSNFIGVPQELMMEGIERLADDDRIVVENICGVDAVYLKALYNDEIFTAETIKNRLDLYSGSLRLSESEINKIIDEGEIEYSKEQRLAIHKAAENGVFVLTGGPGTGKTTTVKGILRVLKACGLKTLLTAPTGRAAKRMTELCGEEAKTIHRLLEASFMDAVQTVEFAKNEKNIVDTDAVIVDETSMVDIRLIAALLRAVRPSTKIIFVGDPDQLPSVGPGSLLSDLISSSAVPSVTLKEIFRQANKSGIVVNAHKINRGEFPDECGENEDFYFVNRENSQLAVDAVLKLMCERIPLKYKIPPMQVQVISPWKQREAGTAALNRIIADKLNPEDETKNEIRVGKVLFREGDKVMQVRNNYNIVWQKSDTGEQGTGIFNGDMGQLVSINKDTEQTVALFDDKIVCYTFQQMNELDLAYAITVHKSQGSEFDAVIISAVGGPEILKRRSILYTAVTRAKKLLIIVGSKSTIAKMVENECKDKRFSALCRRLENMQNDNLQ